MKSGGGEFFIRLCDYTWRFFYLIFLLATFYFRILKKIKSNKVLKIKLRWEYAVDSWSYILYSNIIHKF